MTHRERRSYDHRIKLQITATGDPNLFPEPQIPRSTAMSWIRRGLGLVVALEHGTEDESQLLCRVAKLERNCDSGYCEIAALQVHHRGIH